MKRLKEDIEKNPKDIDFKGINNGTLATHLNFLVQILESSATIAVNSIRKIVIKTKMEKWRKQRI